MLKSTLFHIFLNSDKGYRKIILMRRLEKKTKILLSFVGSNDAGKLIGGTDGAILTVFQERKFDEVHLIWNISNKKDSNFKKIAEYVKGEIIKQGYSKNVYLHKFECKNVTDHNEIYPKLLEICKELEISPDREYTAAIASGTPAMQVCWILMAESGDFPLKLIRSNEPRFGKPLVTTVKLDTSLPRIFRLEQENKELKEEVGNLIPDAVIDIKNGSLKIAGTTIPLSPIEFSYYRYFVQRVKDGSPAERFSNLTVPIDFLKEIIRYHKESFPDAELFREDLKKMEKTGTGLSISTFRGNISKLNTKLKKALSNPGWVKVFGVSIEGKRHAKTYGIKAPKEKIILK